MVSRKLIIGLATVLLFLLFGTLGGFLIRINDVLYDLKRKEDLPVAEEKQQIVLWMILYIIMAGLLLISYFAVLLKSSKGFKTLMILSFLLVGSIAFLMLGRDSLKSIKKELPDTESSDGLKEVKLYLTIANYLSLGIAVLTTALYVFTITLGSGSSSGSSEDREQYDFSGNGQVNYQSIPPQPQSSGYGKLPQKGQYQNPDW